MSVHTVVAAQHPLATQRGQIPITVLAEHIQLTHVDPSDISGAFGVRLEVSRVWRLSQLGAKLAFLRAGFGFGVLPLHAMEADLASGALVEITTEDAPRGGRLIEMWAVYRTDGPPGPAGRWFIDRLKKEQAPPVKREPSRSPPASVGRRRASKRSPASNRKRRV
jgi:DNA-binding transcriptional LysR family regulator